MRLRSSREASTASGARTEKPTSMSVNQSSALSPHAAHWSLVLRYLVRVGVRVRVSFEGASVEGGLIRVRVGLGVGVGLGLGLALKAARLRAVWVVRSRE